MIEIKGNLWDQPDADVIAITTNGTVKKNGRAIMGKGCALEAKMRFKGIDHQLGYLLTHSGNNLYVLTGVKPTIVSFPTKHHWIDKSDSNLIEKSSQILSKWINETNYKKILLPRPGCGNGLLKWDEVKLILEKYFDDRFFIVSK